VAVGLPRAAAAQDIQRGRGGGAIHIRRIGLADLLTGLPGPPETDPNFLHDLVEAALVEPIPPADLSHHATEPRHRGFEGERELMLGFRKGHPRM
jgi:hypothetical protein